MIDKEILSWLTTVPASDGNFKSNLDRADIETLNEALKYKGLSNLGRITIERKIRKLEKKNAAPDVKNSLEKKIIELTCYKCSHKWPYKGESTYYITCPRCYSKLRIGKCKEVLKNG